MNVRTKVHDYTSEPPNDIRRTHVWVSWCSVNWYMSVEPPNNPHRSSVGQQNHLRGPWAFNSAKLNETLGLLRFISKRLTTTCFWRSQTNHMSFCKASRGCKDEKTIQFCQGFCLGFAKGEIFFFFTLDLCALVRIVWWMLNTSKFKMYLNLCFIHATPLHSKDPLPGVLGHKETTGGYVD